ncbi:MAG TPA: FAD-binding protein, partial [Cyclobacteriaceae bacterium]|nr:FAD-binding protein [Cyclobacteriaceae bacterium]
MDKRTFLKTSAALASGSLFTPLIGYPQERKPVKNWAGNLTYHTDKIHVPNSVAELQEVIKKCSKVRPLGSRHSFNTIADSSANLISSSALNKIVSLDKNAKTVTVEAGIKYGELCAYLDRNGFALHNLASLPHISVAGACVTATHGSGVKNGNLAT